MRFPTKAYDRHVSAKYTLFWLYVKRPELDSHIVFKVLAGGSLPVTLTSMPVSYISCTRLRTSEPNIRTKIRQDLIRDNSRFNFDLNYQLCFALQLLKLSA